jgi:hypothetical protein
MPKREKICNKQKILCHEKYHITLVDIATHSEKINHVLIEKKRISAFWFYIKIDIWSIKYICFNTERLGSTWTYISSKVWYEMVECYCRGLS